MSKPKKETPGVERTIPIGARVVQVLKVAYRAGRPALLIGPPGVGKSEIIEQVAAELGIESIVIDLSLCEPSDLVGLPRMDGDRTVFLPPEFLPRAGQGLLVFEELNRAERFVQGPVLQLLSARRLNNYVLPDGWTCVAAINPDDGKNDVRPLDPAMLSRFLQVPVRADRRQWLRWARERGLHAAVAHVVEQHPEAFEQTSPRSWTHAAQVLAGMTAPELGDRALLHDVLAGYLPEAWAVMVTEASAKVRDGDLVVADLLTRCASDETLRNRLDALRDGGRTDVLRAIAVDVQEELRSPIRLSRLINDGGFELESFDALIERLPGDLREVCQEALGRHGIAARLLGVDYDLLLNRTYQDSETARLLEQWQRRPERQHYAQLFVTGLCAHLRAEARLTSVRRANAARRTLGRVLDDLQPPLRAQLSETLQTLLLEPIQADKVRS
jgi:MoxR-like ATPase